MSAIFCWNAWTCACQATDRDLESVFVKRKVNAWIGTPRSTDHDPTLDENLHNVLELLKSVIFVI